MILLLPAGITSGGQQENPMLFKTNIIFNILLTINLPLKHK